MSDQNQGSANLLSNRLAKSLLRFLKPVRSSIARSPDDPKPQHHQSQFKGNIFSLTSTGGKKEDEIAKAIEKDKLRKQNLRLVASNGTPIEEDLEKNLDTAALLATASPLPEKAPAHWLDLVVFLINACRKASAKLRARKGVQAYQAAVNSRGQARIKSIGSIIDTTTIIKSDDEEEAASSESAETAQDTVSLINKKAA